MIWALLLSGCLEGAGPETLAPPSPVWLEAPRVDEGEPVRVHAPEGVILPAVEGIAGTLLGSQGGVATWELRGPPGSYVMDVVTSTGETETLFFDIGVEGPVAGPMADLAGLPVPSMATWPRVVAAAAFVAGVFAAGAFIWRRLKPAPLPPPPEPPERVARRAWAVLRARTDLPPDALAAELSAVYRCYLEVSHGWPATARTSREILDALAGELSAVQLDRARRLLQAMDIVRFSERSTHAGFFTTLDEDFEALLPGGGTRA